MASIGEIKELARQLGLYNIAKGYIDLADEKLSNLDYIASVLQGEVQMREQTALVKREKTSRLPHKVFIKEKVGSGTAWQIEQLETLEWIDEEQNLVIIGKCGSGKTSLAAHLGKLALESGEKVAYATISDFIYTVLHKDETNKQRDRFKYFQSCSLIILDEVMYTRLTPEDLTVFYQYIMLFSESRSIVCITNRELSAWADGAFDRHLMQTLVDRITNGAQVIRLI